MALARVSTSLRRAARPPNSSLPRFSPDWPCTASITFCRQVRRCMRRTSWKERTRPMRATLSGFRPTSSTPFSRTDPLSGRMKPVRRLKTVVLPAPFGPTRAVMVPLRNWMARSSAATMPPKRLLTPDVSRTTGASCQTRSRVFSRADFGLVGQAGARLVHGGRAGRLPVVEHLDADLLGLALGDPAPDREALGEGALGPDPHEHDEGEAVDDQLHEAGRAGLHVDGPAQQRIEQHHDGGAQHGARQVGHAAEDDDGEHRQREREAEHAGGGQLEPGGEERTGESGQRRRDAEGAHLVGEHVLAHGLGGQRVLTDALQHPAEGRLAEPVAEGVHEEHRDERRDDPVARVLHRPAEDVGARQADEAVRAAELGEGGEDPDDHRRDRQRQQDQVLRRQLQGRERDQGADQEGEHHRRAVSRPGSSSCSSRPCSRPCSRRSPRRRRGRPTPARRSPTAG